MIARRFAFSAAFVGVILAGCAGTAYQPSYGFILETHYADGIPPQQQSALADGILTDREVDQATELSDACVAAVPGIASVEPFRWVEQDGEFSGGDIEFEDGVDREAVLDAARECYFEHVALIEFAWLDQFYFGEWTEENLRR